MDAPSELKLYSIWLSFSKKHSYYTYIIDWIIKFCIKEELRDL